MTTATATIEAPHKLTDAKYDCGAYFNGEDGINHRNTDPGYKAEFGTDRVISSAARIAFDSARATGLLNAAFGDFLNFNIKIDGFNGTTITAIFSVKETA